MTQSIIDRKNIISIFVNMMFYCALISLYLSFKFFIFFGITFCFIFRSKTAVVYFFSNLIFPVLLLLFLFFYSLSLGNQLPYPLLESRDILITVLELLLLNALVLSLRGAEKVINALMKIACMVGFLKFVITVYCIATGINASLLVENISKITGWQLMTYDVDQSFISRIQFPIDLCSCFLIYFSSVKIIKKLSLYDVIIFSGIVFSVLITMSRAFWFIAIVMFLLAIYNNLKNKRSFKYISLISLFLAFGYLATYDTTNQIISDRFNTNLTSASDEARTIQNGLLYPQFQQAELFGKGIGYFIPYFTRGEGDNKYAYESQLLAMFMKLGIFGFITLLCWFLYTSFSFEKNIGFKLLFTKLIFFALWVFSGSVNPLLFSTPGGLVLFLCSNIDYNSVKNFTLNKRINGLFNRK